MKKKFQIRKIKVETILPTNMILRIVLKYNTLTMH